MLKEVCFTPQVFDRLHLDISNWKELANLLQVICESGYVLALNNKDWYRCVRDSLNTLEPKVQQRIEGIFSVLKDRDRIAGQPKIGQSLTGENKEEDWLKLAVQLNDVRKIQEIVATEAFGGKAMGIDELEDINIVARFGVTGSHTFPQTERDIRQAFMGFLPYARKVTLIDPYFNLGDPRYQKTLKILADTFMERRGERDRGTILVHCRWHPQYEKEYAKGTGESRRSDTERWQRCLASVYQEYHHDVELNAWEELRKKMHDRYIITNQCGVVTGAGTDVDPNKESEWSLKDFTELHSIRSQFTENANVYKLKCIVTRESIKIR